MNQFKPVVDFFHPYLFLDIFSSPTLERILFIILFALIIHAVFWAEFVSIKKLHSHWHHLFETQPFKSSEFYTHLEKEINEKTIEGISFYNVEHSERGILSAKRKYLRIKFRGYLIDICAAPFGKEAFFISWWFGEPGSTLYDYIISIPVIGPIFTKREKTFFEQDTEIMFKETISKCVQETIEKLVSTKGERLLNQIDWKGWNRQFKNR